MKVIISQFAKIEPNSRSFNKYINNECKKQKIDLIVLGEYTSSSFFKEYKQKDKSKIQKLFIEQTNYFTQLAKKYSTTIVAPIIEYKDNKVFKSIMIANSTKASFYKAQKLMSMEHWNEEAFFDNAKKAKEPFIFEVCGFKVSAIFGWESHFDEIWIKLNKKNVDIVIVPTANTFNSNLRWARLLQTRSFLNNCFVIRVNRTGEYIENNVSWQFYGNSFVALPDGNLGDMLGQKDGILVCDIKKSILNEAKNIWKFR